MACSFCGVGSAANSRFCSECGKPLLTPETNLAGPQNIVIEGKEYKPAPANAKSELRGLYSYEGKWYRIEDNRAVLESLGATQTTNPVVWALVFIGITFVGTFLAALNNNPVNEFMKEITGLDIQAQFGGNASRSS